MPRRKELTPEEQARRDLAAGFLKSAEIKDPADLQKLIKEMMKQVVESSLEGELDEELGYTRYDYRNTKGRFFCVHTNTSPESALKELESRCLSPD
jgi:hypothetical protein